MSTFVVKLATPNHEYCSQYLWVGIPSGKRYLGLWIFMSLNDVNSLHGSNSRVITVINDD
ncbi:hypothetical protein [Dendronalium sp. ChiSLP03b]|uniref:hypothetical protein n=1 Tax=Dendronalium sp. ChiSLP03b TaxID=3075381 RepID=UPI002AD568F6|nr:hypothetical protein [Dendronalium sp. ChiSLP03b]MDZ8205960.1 hypothetical protein [Dendronalium sp. ChiSLP03b]